MTDHPRQGLFSSFSLGRASKSAKGPTEPTLAHPLLGASTSSLNINDASSSQSDNAHRPSGHGRQGSSSSAAGRSVSTAAIASGTGDVLHVPYKPRQRNSYTHGSTNSVSSVNSTTTGQSVSPSIGPSAGGTSPVAPTASIAAPPTTSTSTSTTFALPPSAITAETTSVETMTSSPTTGGSSSATSRLQLQSLKAAAQKIGLGNGSMGMGIIDTIYEKGQAGRGKADTSEWSEVLKLIAGGKAVLLLPTTPASSLPVTPQIIRDHIAFLSPNLPSSSGIQEESSSVRSEGSTSAIIVTLSGIVGTVRGSTMTFETTLPADSSILAAIRDSVVRTATLSALRPITSASSASHFPTSILSADTANLPFPPLNKASSSNLAETKETKTPAGKLARINPFASLFGASSAPSPALGTSPGSSSATGAPGDTTPERPRSPAYPISPPHGVVSPKPSLLALDVDTASIRSDMSSRDLEGYQITAYTVSKAVRHGDISKSIHKALKTTIREELHRLPEKVVEKVFKLVAAGACPTYSASSDSKSETNAVQLDYSDPTAAGERLQEFIEGVYDELILHFRADSSHLFAENSEYSSIRRKASWSRKGVPLDMNGEVDPEEAKRERKEKFRREKEVMVEREASEGTERVEAVVCRMLYNRLFSPIESDDSRHDEALSSRIAALNMLDLSLDHLGLVTRPDDEPDAEKGLISRGLSEIVDRIGDELQKLSTSNCLTPKEKGDVLIQAHKLVVDGLAQLPPIDLRPEGEPYTPPPVNEFDAANKLPTAPSVPSTSSESSLSESVTSPDTTTGPATISMQKRRSSSNTSTPLSTSPASSDPLTTISEVLEKTPQALRGTATTEVPRLVLTDSTKTEDTDASRLEEAMSDSVMTLQAPTTSEKSPDRFEEKSKPKTSTSGADLILPIIIYAVVKSNPPQLASQLMYLRRYRSAICLTGEASYAIVNLTAVVEFLEHVELSQLGLGDESDKVISVEDLTPISLNYLDESNADTASIASASSRLRGRVFQVGEMAGSAADSANKVLTGVVDSSWTALRGLIASPNSNNPADSDGAESVPPLGDARPGMRPRQASTFSLASVTASVATIAAAAANRSRSRANSRASNLVNPAKEEYVWKGNEEMVEVPSRAASIRDKDKDRQTTDYCSDSSDGSESEDEGRLDMGIGKKTRERRRSDTRSIMSVSSALSRVKSRDTQAGDKEKRDREEEGRDRVSISDRLASIGARGILSNQPETPSNEASQAKTVGFIPGITSKAGIVSGHSRRLSLLGGTRNAEASPGGSTVSLPSIHAQSAGQDIEPPIEQFMTCDVGDIKLSEIGILLRDYRRLGGIVNSLKAASTPPG